MVTRPSFIGANNPNNQSSATSAPTASFIITPRRGALPWDEQGVQLGTMAIATSSIALASMQRPAPSTTPRASM